MMELNPRNIGRLSSLMLALVVLAGCGFLNSGPSNDNFSLTYRAHNGLDCGMLFECGYRIELSEDRVLQFFNEPYDTESIAEVTISQSDVDEIWDILSQYEFFSSEYDWTEDEGSLSRGSTYINYQSSDSNETRSKTIPFEGDGIPESLMSLRLELDNSLRSKIGIG